MLIDILSLFPEYFSGPFDQSMIKQAVKKGILNIRLTDIRDFAEDKHKRVDDRPYGGGPGMVMKAPPVAKAIKSVATEKSHVVYVSPKGIPLTAEKCRALAEHDHVVFLCGHYEGVDQRVIDLDVDEEISIGDFVLTNGCLAAIVIIDALVRFVPGVLGHQDAAGEDSFEQGILDCPHYTKPEVYEGLKVPQVLLEGHHEKIKEWRKAAALDLTRKRRPDLWIRYLASSSPISFDKKRKKNTLLSMIDNEQVPQLDFTLTVEDLAKSLKFYCTVMGFAVNKQSPDKALMMLGHQKITLVQARDKLDSPSVTFQWQVSDETILQNAAEWAIRSTKGQVIVDGNQQIAGIEIQDPDGYLWSLSRTVRQTENEEKKS